MKRLKRQRLVIVLESILLAAITVFNLVRHAASEPTDASVGIFLESSGQGGYIKWVDFNVTKDAMKDAYGYDVGTYGSEIHLDWIALLAYQACRNGGDFAKYKSGDLAPIAKKLAAGEISVEELTADLKYYNYYYEAYSAVLGGLVGEYEIQVLVSDAGENGADSGGDGSSADSRWEKKYGLKGFLPIAKNFPYSDYDDFGASRSYGYKREHLGHDMMGQTGTPVIAVESGYVEAIGWNQYGGWRLGIRSFDKKRYYYYAHLRQNYPYCKTLEEGSVVTAGDVIGYMGHTGYSKTENVNNIETPHLHFGLQLIFDESQKDGTNQIWVSCYELTKFLYQNRSEAAKIGDSKEWVRTVQMRDPAVEKYNAKKTTPKT